MKKHRSLTPITFALILLVIATAFAISVYYLMIDKEANGIEPELVQKTYHLGDQIYSDRNDYYFYHGIYESRIIIGHWITQGMSNMCVQIDYSRQFYIEDVRFRIVDYSSNEGWIILER